MTQRASVDGFWDGLCAAKNSCNERVDVETVHFAVAVHISRDSGRIVVRTI